MNADSQPPLPPDPEARITAWLLGELAPDDAAALAKEVEQNPALRLLRDRLAGTIHFLRCAATDRPAEPASTAVPQPKLSTSRREKLLASFKVVPLPARKAARFYGMTGREWLVTAAACAVFMAVAAGMLLPALSKAKSKGLRISANNTVRQSELNQELGLAEAGRKSGEAATTLFAMTSPNRSEVQRSGETAAREPATKVDIYLPKSETEANFAAPVIESESRGGRMDLAMMTRYGLLSADAKQQPISRGESLTPQNSTEANSAKYDPAALPAVRRQADWFYRNNGDGSFAANTEGETVNGRADVSSFGNAAGAGGFGGFGGGGLGANGPQGAAAAGAEVASSSESRDKGIADRAWGDYDNDGYLDLAVRFAPTQQHLAPTQGLSRGLTEAKQVTAVAANEDFAGIKETSDASIPNSGTVLSAGGVAAGLAGRPGLATKESVVEENLAPLPIKLPIPAFMGTPTDLPLGEPGAAPSSKVVLGRRAAPLSPAPSDQTTSSQRGRSEIRKAAESDGKADIAGKQVYFAELADGIAAKDKTAEETMVKITERAVNAAESFGVPVVGQVVSAEAGMAPPPPAPTASAAGLWDTSGRPTSAPTLGDTPMLGRAFTAVPAKSLELAKKSETSERGERFRYLAAKDTEEFNLPQTVAGGDKLAEVPAVAAEGDERKLKRVMGNELALAKSLDTLQRQTNALGFQFSYSLAAADSEAARPEVNAPTAAPVERLQEMAAEERFKRPTTPPATPQPEVVSAENAFSTFSLNVTDVSFKLAAASLENGQLPDPGSIRTEEFINAFDYRDAHPVAGSPLGFNWERARYPFAHNRDVLRFAVRTAAQGREAGRPLNLVLLLDNSGSMERADRVQIIREALGVLAGQVQAQDKLSVVAFARTARLWVDGLPGGQAGELVNRVGDLVPEGGTNLEDALGLAYDTAARHFDATGINRVVLLTDGAANLGEVNPETLKARVESWRQRGVALDCFGIGWEGYNDDLLEILSRNGDGRYGFINTPEEASGGFASQLAGALQVAAADVKVQVEFNPQRVTAWRQIGYAKHQLTKEQFRDNTVDAAELGAAEAGNGLYMVEVNPQGQGNLGVVRARYREPATGNYREIEWPLAYAGQPVPLENASPTLKLAATAAAFSESLAANPYAAEVTNSRLLQLIAGVPAAFDLDPRPAKLEWMIRQAQSLGAR